MLSSDVFNLQKQGNDHVKYCMVLMDFYLDTLKKETQNPPQKSHT